MYTITMTINDIDYKRLVDQIGKPKPTAPADNNKLQKVMPIIAPFIDKAMGIIPDAVVVKLFNILAREKLIDLADEYGITVSELAVDVRAKNNLTP